MTTRRFYACPESAGSEESAAGEARAVSLWAIAAALNERGTSTKRLTHQCNDEHHNEVKQ